MPDTSSTGGAHLTADHCDGPIDFQRFVERVRRQLDADGQHDIPISRQWIDQETPGYRFHLHVPIGAELLLSLKPLENLYRFSDPSVMERHVKDFASALLTLRKVERKLIKYSRDMRRAAADVITDARAQGLDLLLVDVGFKPTYASHLTYASLQDSLSHILAVVKVRQTSGCLRPELTEIVIEEPEDVIHELEEVIEEQRARQGRLAQLDAIGADLVVDAITLDLLRAHVPDVEEVLREAWRNEGVSVPVVLEGHDTWLRLMTINGTVESSLDLKDVFWSEGHVHLLGVNAENGLDLVGKTLVGKVKHPVLSSYKVVHIDRSFTGSGGSDGYQLDQSKSFLFNADTGRIWPNAELLREA